MVSSLIVNGVTIGVVMFIGLYFLWYAWMNFGLANAYYSIFSGKKRRAIKLEIIANNYDALEGDAKITAYLRNPIISKARPELITQAEIELEKEKPLKAMKQFIRLELEKSNYQNSPIVYETIKLSLLKQGFNESLIKRTIKQIQKETKHGTRQIWGDSSSSAREVPSIDRGTIGSSPIGADSSSPHGNAKPGNIPVGTLETLGTTQRPNDRTSPSHKRKSIYFD